MPKETIITYFKNITECEVRKRKKKNKKIKLALKTAVQYIVFHNREAVVLPSDPHATNHHITEACKLCVSI